jgi:osmoprotectant transport system permease protein
VLTASVLCVVLAVVADLLLLGVQRLLTPWTRIRAAAAAPEKASAKEPRPAARGAV